MIHVAPEHKTGSDRAAATASAKPLLWTIRNKRYAVPASFVARHPGGMDAITLGQGRNCTELFESYHALSDKPERLLAAWFVENVQPGEADFDTTFDWEGDKAVFYADLKRETRAFFAGRSHKADWSKWLVVLSCAALTAACFVWGFLGGHWWAPVVLPWLYWLGPACMLHDGSHFALSTLPAVNRCCAALGSYHMGVWAWYHQHVVGHHAHTNMLDKDPDLRAFEGVPPEHFYGHRLTPWAPYFPMYRRWLRSLLITMPFSCLQPSIRQDSSVWLSGHYDSTVPVTVRPPAWRVVFHVCVRALLWSALFVLPFFLFSPAKALFFALWPGLSYGVLYYIFSQISHINEDCFQTVVPSRDWAAHQVASSLDWGAHHWFWKYLSIALNLQTVHHLFPQVDSCHYIALRKAVIVPVCRRHNVRINEAATLWEAIRIHFKHVYAINRGGVNDSHAAGRPKSY